MKTWWVYNDRLNAPHFPRMVAVHLASEVEAALAEKDSEIAKLREQVEALRKSREAWMEAYKNPHWYAYLAQTEAADAKAREVGAIE